ncbi:FGGY-family carbohydrate kinase [Aggregatilinea lenta]|uniref:FGGY-family carbohydrate kinase n=1 Tax=Aggregatilinea lenta TaxID=913108 RepID=UPI000E5A6FE2|nr:FGGY-family carbohydrate kinase [Aggregatilinea lenta]
MGASQDYLLGVDAGTSVVKAALFTADGREVGSVARRTTVKTPHSAWAETSMDETWVMAASAIRAVLAESDVDPAQIAAVGLSGNMVGAWLLDAQGRPVRDAILWADGRTQPLIDRFSAEQPGFMSHIFDHSASVMQQGCTLPVLRWLAEHEPDVLDRAVTLVGCKDWLAYNLTGTIQIDPTEAPGMPGDIRTRGYSDAMIALFGLDAYRRLFPPIRPSEQVIGTVQPRAAALTGLAAGTPVVLGAGDVPASALGVGAVDPGVACSLLGTNFLNCLVVDQPVFEPRDVGVSFLLPGGRWLRATINVSGTTSLDWAIEQFCGPEKAAADSTAALFEGVEALVRASPIGANGAIYLPYLSANGIIAPVADPAARADFFGLTNEHTRGDLLRAVYEGLAFSIRDGYDVIPAAIHEIRLSGGAAKSAFFCQMVADVTGRRVLVPAGSEFGAKGAALLAAVGIRWYPFIADAVHRTASACQVYECDPAAQRAYEATFATYTQLREALRPVWQAHAARRS